MHTKAIINSAFTKPVAVVASRLTSVFLCVSFGTNWKAKEMQGRRKVGKSRGRGSSNMWVQSPPPPPVEIGLTDLPPLHPRLRQACGKEEMCKARPKSTKDIHFRRHSLQEIFGLIEYLNKAKTFTVKVIFAFGMISWRRYFLSLSQLLK